MRGTGSRFSLRRRLLLRLLLPLILLVTLSGSASYAFALHYANSVYDDWLYDSANSLALAVQENASGATLDLSASAQRLFEWDVIDTTYFKVSSSRSGLIGGRATLPEPSSSPTQLRDAQLFNANVDGRPVRVAILPLPVNRFGEAISVEVAETKNKRLALASKILISTLLPQALLILVAGVLIWLGVSRGLSPLTDVAKQLGEQTHRALKPIPDRGVPTEVLPLTGAVNDLLARLESALAAQRRFVADAAHQLRTPLTGLQLHIEEAQRESTMEGVAPLLGQMHVSAVRAARLSNQLLALARAEPGARIAETRTSFDLGKIAREAGAEWAARALDKGLDLGFVDASERIQINGDPVMLREAINNLLDNAVKYHPGPGNIEIEVRAYPLPTVTISDDGPGIPDGLRANVFRRFNRGDRSNNTEGSGLGLPIVQEIAAAHGGNVRLESGLGERGLRVCLELPLQAAFGNKP